MSLVYERHTIAFFGPLAQPNYQMYSVVITNKNIFTSYTARTSTQQNLQIYSCYQYKSLCIFISVCFVLSKTPIKLYSQRQLLRNNHNNSFCIFIICACLVLSKTPIHQLVDITNITCIVSLTDERQLYDCDLNVRRTYR